MRISYLLTLIICCSNHSIINENVFSNAKSEGIGTKLNDSILVNRFEPPTTYNRMSLDTNSFAYYLRHLPLKPKGSKVKLYNGDYKPNNNVYDAVVDMEISPKDLQQCADAVMRLRGEYLFKQKKYNQISFKFLGDGKMHDYITYTGNNRSYKKFRNYMDYVFAYANTASLKSQLKKANYYDIKIGDVFIQSGQPYGHAVIVVDICENLKGDKNFMLAQSYMPAQETQILLNPSTSNVWYGKPNGTKIITPEWTFDTSMLKRW
jgi:hypothetical protein